MQLYYFLAIILSLSFGSLPDTPQTLSRSVGFSASVMVAWWVLCGLAVRLMWDSVRSGDIQPAAAFEWFDRQLACFRWLSLGLIVLCLGGFGLARNLTALPVIEHSVALQSLLLLLPALLSMIGLWVAEYVFAARLGWADTGMAATVRFVVSVGRATLGWLLLPIFVLLGLFDLLSLGTIGDRVPAWMVMAALGFLVLSAVPLLIRRVFPTTSIDANDMLWLRQLLSAAGVANTSIAIWDTGHRRCNAMVAGFLGRFRVLLLSDRIVAELTRPQLAMVVLHEVAHLRRRHVPLRIAALVPAWLLGMAVDHVAGLSAVGSGIEPWASTLGSGTTIAATVVILRWVSHRVEHDADRVACRMAPQIAAACPDVPASETEAARVLAAALRRVTHGDKASQKSTWLHPGIDQRVRHIGGGGDGGPSGDRIEPCGV